MVNLKQTTQLLRCRNHRSLHKEPGLEAGQAVVGVAGAGDDHTRNIRSHIRAPCGHRRPERMGTVPGSPGRLAATIQMAAPLAAPEIWCQIPQAAGETAQTASLRVGLPFLQRRQQWKRPAVARAKGSSINSVVFPDGTGTLANRRDRSNTPARTPDNTARITRTDSGMYIVQSPVTTAPPHEPLAVQGVSPGADSLSHVLRCICKIKAPGSQGMERSPLSAKRQAP